MQTVRMITEMVGYLHLPDVEFRIVMIHPGRGQTMTTIGHLIEVLGRIGTLVGNQDIRITGLTGPTHLRVSGAVEDTLGPLEVGPQIVEVEWLLEPPIWAGAVCRPTWTGFTSPDSEPGPRPSPCTSSK